jgi:Hypoxia induced protein conserved region
MRAAGRAQGEGGAMDILTLLIILALLATVISLGLGVRSMAKGGEYDQAHSTQFMVMRVGFQGVALVLLVIALLVK